MKHSTVFRSNDMSDYFFVVLAFLCTVVVLGLAIYTMIASNFPVTEAIITIDSKEFADSTYLIWDTEGNVYRVDDSILEMRFDSSNDYYNLKVGNTYSVRLRGQRVPLVSTYPNIVQYEQVGE